MKILSKLFFILFFFALTQARAQEGTGPLWPELALSLGSSQVVGDPGSQSASSFDLAVMLWGGLNLETAARTGFFALEFGNYGLSNSGTQFLGSNDEVRVSTTSLIPYMRIWGHEDEDYLLLGAGVRLSTLSSSSAAGENNQTFGGYVFAVEYLKKIAPQWRVGAKLNWGDLRQVIQDRTSFLETSQFHVVISYQP